MSVDRVGEDRGGRVLRRMWCVGCGDIGHGHVHALFEKERVPGRPNQHASKAPPPPPDPRLALYIRLLGACGEDDMGAMGGLRMWLTSPRALDFAVSSPLPCVFRRVLFFLRGRQREEVLIEKLKLGGKKRKQGNNSR